METGIIVAVMAVIVVAAGIYACVYLKRLIFIPGIIL